MLIPILILRKGLGKECKVHPFWKDKDQTTWVVCCFTVHFFTSQSSHSQSQQPAPSYPATLASSRSQFLHKVPFFPAFSIDFPSMAAINRDSTPPPVIGKIGPYTVFMTPPSTPKPSSEPVFDSSKKIVPPPVQPPPPQIEKLVAEKSIADEDGSVLGFFKNAVAKVQTGMLFLHAFLACVCS